MAKVADQLRQAREARELTVHQVAEFTKIRTDHIRALDEGDYDVFPAPVYIRGFVRTYATFLKLDVDNMMTQLQAELGQTEKHRDHPPLDGKQRSFLDFVMFQLSRLNWRIVLPAFVVAVILISSVYGYRTWRNYKDKDPLAGLGSGKYESTKTAGGEVLPLTGNQKR